MVKPDHIPAGSRTQPPGIVAIISKKRIVELWHIGLLSTAYREREIALPAQPQLHMVNGRWERYLVHRRQFALQEWGRFVIRRYQATRMLAWTPSIGLAMLIPGTLLAAGTANQGIADAPLALVIAQSALITIGGVLALGSGWRIASHRITLTGGRPLESLGVSGHALGFPSGTVASESLPTGYRPGRLRGVVEVELPVGEWNLVKEEEYSPDSGWSAIS